MLALTTQLVVAPPVTGEKGWKACLSPNVKRDAMTVAYGCWPHSRCHFFGLRQFPVVAGYMQKLAST